jgi:hypothetical protein
MIDAGELVELVKLQSEQRIAVKCAVELSDAFAKAERLMLLAQPSREDKTMTNSASRIYSPRLERLRKDIQDLGRVVQSEFSSHR